MLTDMQAPAVVQPAEPGVQRGAGRAPVSPPPALGAPLPQGGLVDMGHAARALRSTTKRPATAVWLQPFALANRLVTHGEWAAFMADGGYTDPRWWLSAGWDWVRSQRIRRRCTGAAATQHHGAVDWHSFTLHGLVPIDAAHTHGAHQLVRGRCLCPLVVGPASWPAPAPAHRRPSGNTPPRPCDPNGLAAGNFLERRAAPHAAGIATEGLMQMRGDVWEWTGSSYLPYPGYQALERRGGRIQRQVHGQPDGAARRLLCHPALHIRASYRNFFPTDARHRLRLARMRWQFMRRLPGASGHLGARESV
jgi:formylglycine-generating enzyme required for sulfatase activity